jgi:hypothetical protein
MGTPLKKTGRLARSRGGRASLIRNRIEYLGSVDAPDESSAEAAATEQFGLSDHQRKRLVLRKASGS